MTTARLLDLVRENRELVQAAVERHHGLTFSVFGSVARGEDTETSDIDILVRFAPGSSLFDLLHLTDELEQILGRPIDVVSEAALKPRDHHIYAEAIRI